MKASTKVVQNGIYDRIDKMILNSRNMTLLWKRSLRKYYIDYQKERFLSSNQRNGGWLPLSSRSYGIWKQTHAEVKRFGRMYPMVAGGSELMAASGLLAKAVTLEGESNWYRVDADERSVNVYTQLPYAKYYIDKKYWAAQNRSIATFDKEFKNGVKRMINQFIRTGE
jgi:hypothetical protein